MRATFVLVAFALAAPPAHGNDQHQAAVAGVPRWTAPPLPKYAGNASVNATVAYGMPVAQGAASAKIYNATREMGVYSHGPMIAFHSGHFLATWKNAVLSEDTPGQRVLWAWASERAPLQYSAPAVLFPNISNGSCTGKSKPDYPPNPSYRPGPPGAIKPQ
jgi:hypothetical protein